MPLGCPVSYQYPHTSRRNTEGKGANLDIQDEAGDTALLLAARTGGKAHQNIRLLLKAGADVNVPGENSLTALHHAAHEGDKLSLDALTSTYELNPDPRDQHGSTPLHNAIATLGKTHAVDTQKHFIYAIEQLCKANANLSVRDCRGRSCQDRIDALIPAKRKHAQDAVTRGQRSATSAKTPPPRTCTGCGKSRAQSQFRYAEWERKGECRMCVQKKLTVTKEVDQLYIPTELKEIDGIVPSYEQQVRTALAKKHFKQRHALDEDAGQAKDMNGLIDEILIENDAMPFDKVVRLLRNKGVYPDRMIFKDKSKKKKQDYIDALYWRHCYRKAIGYVAEGLVIMEIRDPIHPVAIYKPEGGKGYGLFVDSARTEPIQQGQIIGEYVGEVVDTFAMQQHEDAGGAVDEEEIAMGKDLSNEEYLMKMESSVPWFHRRGGEQAEENCFHVNARCSSFFRQDFYSRSAIGAHDNAGVEAQPQV
jgi:hypothetical protein